MTHDNVTQEGTDRTVETSNADSKKDPKTQENECNCNWEHLKEQLDAIKELLKNPKTEDDLCGELKVELEKIVKKRLGEIVNNLDKETKKQDQGNILDSTVEQNKFKEEQDKELRRRNKMGLVLSWATLLAILVVFIVFAGILLGYSVHHFVTFDVFLSLFIGSMSILLVLATVAIVILCQIKSFSCPKSEKSSE